MSLNIAIVGLGRVGSEFLDEVLKHTSQGFKIALAAELGDTPGKQKARDLGVKLGTLDEIVEMGESVDIIFDLTGSRTVRRLLRDSMAARSNGHTVIAPETMSRMMWSLMTDKPLPDVHGHAGY